MLLRNLPLALAPLQRTGFGEDSIGTDELTGLRADVGGERALVVPVRVSVGLTELAEVLVGLPITLVPVLRSGTAPVGFKAGEEHLVLVLVPVLGCPVGLLGVGLVLGLVLLPEELHLRLQLAVVIPGEGLELHLLGLLGEVIKFLLDCLHSVLDGLVLLLEFLQLRLGLLGDGEDLVVAVLGQFGDGLLQVLDFNLLLVKGLLHLLAHRLVVLAGGLGGRGSG